MPPPVTATATATTLVAPPPCHRRRHHQECRGLCEPAVRAQPARRGGGALLPGPARGDAHQGRGEGRQAGGQQGQCQGQGGVRVGGQAGRHQGQGGWGGEGRPSVQRKRARGWGPCIKAAGPGRGQKALHGAGVLSGGLAMTAAAAAAAWKRASQGGGEGVAPMTDIGWPTRSSRAGCPACATARPRCHTSPTSHTCGRCLILASPAAAGSQARAATWRHLSAPVRMSPAPPPCLPFVPPPPSHSPPPDHVAH